MPVKQKLISIIIPVYNSEKYLKKCIESVIAQTYSNFECILVDDGSIDSSSNIYNKYTKNDTRFKIIRQQNLGASAARNTGLKHVSGEYVCFIDSDDFVLPNYLSKMYFLMNSSGVDLVVCKIKEIYNGIDFNVRDDIIPFETGIDSFENYMIKLMDYQSFTGPYVKLFKKKYIIASFDESTFIGEDTIFVLDYIKNIKSIKLTTDIIYIRNVRYNSLSRKYNFITRYSLINLYNKYIEFCHELNFSKQNMDIVNKNILNWIYSMIAAEAYNEKKYAIYINNVYKIITKEIFIALKNKYNVENNYHSLQKFIYTFLINKKMFFLLFYSAKIKKYYSFLIKNSS